VPEKLSTPDDGRQAVVLLVEDDPDVAAYTGMVLRRLAGARVLDVAGADAALAVLAAEDVDVVVTDIDLLPGAHGLELTAHVRERYPLLPVVVVVSGHPTFDHAVVAMRAGAAAVILVHNHPAGIAEPSQADKLVTRRLREALALVDISVRDHLIVRFYRFLFLVCIVFLLFRRPGLFHRFVLFREGCSMRIILGEYSRGQNY